MWKGIFLVQTRFALKHIYELGYGELPIPSYLDNNHRDSVHDTQALSFSSSALFNRSLSYSGQSSNDISQTKLPILTYV